MLNHNETAVLDI